MRIPRALPMIQLMPAASSRQPPDATTSGRPGKNERPQPSPGTPIGHHVAGSHRIDPRTQIRLGVGAHSHPRPLTTVH